MWMSHGTHVNESWYTREWVMSHTYTHLFHILISGSPYVNESWYTRKWVMVHTWMSRVLINRCAYVYTYIYIYIYVYKYVRIHVCVWIRISSKKWWYDPYTMAIKPSAHCNTPQHNVTQCNTRDAMQRRWRRRARGTLYRVAKTHRIPYLCG